MADERPAGGTFWERIIVHQKGDDVRTWVDQKFGNTLTDLAFRRKSPFVVTPAAFEPFRESDTPPQTYQVKFHLSLIDPEAAQVGDAVHRDALAVHLVGTGEDHLDRQLIVIRTPAGDLQTYLLETGVPYGVRTE